MDGRASRVVPRGDVLELLDDVKDSIPAELDDAQDVLDQRDKLVGDARVHAETAISEATSQSDAMVSDISSVVSDFIASGKPYAVTDSGELGEEEFKRQNTAVRAAVILSNSAEEIDGLLAAVSDASADPLKEARHELKSYLLGPDEPTSIDQFNTAVANLSAKAETRNVGQVSPRVAAGAEDEGELAEAMPAQRMTASGDTDVSAG